MFLRSAPVKALQSVLCSPHASSLPAAAMQAGRKRKVCALLPLGAVAQPPVDSAAVGALQPARRRLRSRASAPAVEPEQPAAEQPSSGAASAVAVATPPAKARRRRATGAPAASLAPTPVLAVAVQPTAVPLPAWTRERLADAAEHLRRVDSSARCCCP